MPWFGKKQKASSGEGFAINDLDEILAYLDELVRRRISVSFEIKGRNYESDILFLESKTKAMRIQSGDTARIPNGTPLTVGFTLDKTWWTFQTKLAVIEDKPYLLIPRTINHSERRLSPRCGFSPREQVKVTILEGLGSGNGVFGLAKDISTDGMCITIDKAMHLASEKEVSPGPSLFEPGTPLAMIKINRIPGLPLLEISGTAKRVFRDGKWCFAFQFAKLSKTNEQMILRFIEPRMLEFKPTRRSYKKRLEYEGEGGGVGSSLPSGEAGAARAPRPPSGSPSAPGGAEELPESAAAIVEEGAVRYEDKIKALVIGDLIEELAFLDAPSSPFVVIQGTTPVGIIKALTESSPALLICGVDFKGRSMVEVLEKIANMGLGKSTTIVICANELPSKERIKFKMLQIENLIEPPQDGDIQSFMDKLQAFLPTSP